MMMMMIMMMMIIIIIIIIIIITSQCVASEIFTFLAPEPLGDRITSSTHQCARVCLALSS
jgi:hypothetical protein